MNPESGNVLSEIEVFYQTVDISKGDFSHGDFGISRLSLDLREDITTIEQEMTIKTLANGYRMGEVPAHEYARSFGESKIKLWRVSDGTLLRTLTTPGGVSSVAFAPDGQILASAGFDIELWRVSGGGLMRKCPSWARMATISAPDRSLMGASSSVASWSRAPRCTQTSPI